MTCVMKRLNRSLADLICRMLLHSSFLNSLAASLRFSTSSTTVVAELEDNIDSRPLMVAIPVAEPEFIELRKTVTAPFMLLSDMI